MTDGASLPDDELVSAYLDGEATPDEVARVESDPALQARLAVFRANSARVGRTPAIDPSGRDTQIARAIEAGSPAALGESAPAAVHDLGEARRRRTRALLLGAAAAVLAVVAAAGVLPGLLDDDEGETAAPLDTTEKSSDAAIDEADGGADADAPAPAAGEALPSTSVAPEAATGGPPTPLPDLGAFATRAELDAALAAAVSQELQGRSTAPPAPAFSSPTSPCGESVITQDPELIDLVYAARADLAGSPVEVLVFRTDPASSANGPLRLYLLDARTCAPIADGVETLGP
jgi:hypothetical protein